MSMIVTKGFGFSSGVATVVAGIERANVTVQQIRKLQATVRPTRLSVAVRFVGTEKTIRPVEIMSTVDQVKASITIKSSR